MHYRQAITSHSEWKAWPEAHSPEIIGILKQDVITFKTTHNTTALAMKKKKKEKQDQFRFQGNCPPTPPLS